MKIHQKLKIIQKATGKTQSQIAQEIGVSFATFNSWINQKSNPRIKMQNKINEMYLEVTGQKIIPDEIINAKKELLKIKSLKYKNLIKMIIKNPDIRNEIILKLTYHTNKIEGSTLSEAETASIIFDNVSIPNKTLIEQLEAKNHQTAVIKMFDFISQNKKIDENFILKIHSILMNGIISNAGSYRNHTIRIVGANVPTANYISIPNLMSKLITKINSKDKDIISLSSRVHSEFEQIHPFSDGNGRTGRILLSAILLKENYAPAIIKQEEKQLYYTYLNKSQVKNDYTQLEDLICESIFLGFDIIERKTRQ
jgi:Fic family protein